MKLSSVKLSKRLLRCKVGVFACALAASPAFAGALSDPVVEPAVTAPAAVQAATHPCIRYIDTLVWWDRGTRAFVTQIQTRIGGDRRTAARLARQYCRESKLENPYAQRNLDAGIAAAAIVPSDS
ncbi:hypothetical protein [Primorskyibacter marinus]|uniref:hypothetical protein n=1 Tax=Primorskyibacter marinus TaxID=1977320 RepID=UPI000E305CB3|nr:hypothetical protein [Primorskyibacter marinus]